MTTIWKDGGDCGGEYRGIVDEDETYIIARVRIRRGVLCSPALNPARPWPEGEANFRLILSTPQMLEALEAIVALSPPRWANQSDVLRVHHQCKEIARAAIATVKGEKKWQ